MADQITALFLFLLITPYICQANTDTGKESIQFSINMVSDDSGCGDRTFTISLAPAAALTSNKSVSLKVGDALRVKDNVGFVLLDNETAFINCLAYNPLHGFHSSNANYTLRDPGLFYVTSLNVDLCNHGAKMIIYVGERENTTSQESPHQISSDSSAAPSSSIYTNNMMAVAAFWLFIYQLCIS